MVIGVLQFELQIPHGESLKDKRRVVKSLKDRLHREHLVSIAEVGALESLRTARLGLAVVSGDARRASEVLDRVLAKVRTVHDARLGAVRREMIHGAAEEGDGEGDGVGASADEAWLAEERRMMDEAERLLGEGPR
jgi:uncharacterized protein YlxP (DUF503 family)